MHVVLALLLGLSSARAEPAEEPCAKGAEGVDDCCPKVAPTQGDPWAGAVGLDFALISRGEEVDLQAHQPPDKITIFEFGARWCGPCWPMAATLTEALRERPYLAIRAIELAGADAFQSFEQPVVKQHIATAEGLPWLVVRNAKGKLLYQGTDAARALAVAERKGS